MRRLPFILLVFPLTAVAQMNLIIGKTWAYQKIVIIYQQDSLVVFDADSAKNHWYMGRVSMAFNVNHTYKGTDINGQPQNGTWATLTPQTLTVDRDTNQVLTISSRRFATTAPIHYRDPTTNVMGTLYTEFYAVPAPSGSCVTIQSGDWTNPASWSCGHEPTISDLVIINPSHTITISTNSAQAQRLIFNGGTIKYTTAEAKIFLKKNEL